MCVVVVVVRLAALERRSKNSYISQNPVTQMRMRPKTGCDPDFLKNAKLFDPKVGSATPLTGLIVLQLGSTLVRQFKNQNTFARYDSSG